MKQPSLGLLIVEDEPVLRATMADALRKQGWLVEVAEDGVAGTEMFEQQCPDVVISSLVMPRLGGFDLLKRVKRLRPETVVIIIAAQASLERVVEIMRAGATDFLRKPFSMALLLDKLEAIRAARQQDRLRFELRGKPRSFTNIIGRSHAMQEVFELIRLVASSNSSVLLQGESGTGKELVASAIHHTSFRRSKPYLRVSCASLPESLIESELFGYEKGAFTGAGERRLGRFEAASGGTLFLDEISELPLTFQVKLLRVLQERQIERLGSNRPIDVDVRIISASQHPIEEEIRAGRFREDLYFRVNTVTIKLPPLRQRLVDIPLLAGAFLQESAQERGVEIDGFTDDVLEVFEAHHWPGNVRELRNVVERSVLFAKGRRVTVNELPPTLRHLPAQAPADEHEPQQRVLSLRRAVEQAQIQAIITALEATGNRRAKAASLLGISRKTLWEKIKELQIEVPTHGAR